MNEMEFKTFRAVAKPGRKIPGFSDEELVFLIGYYIFAILLMIFGLGIIPNFLGIKVSNEFSNTFMYVFFVLVPLVTLIIIKTAQVGRQDGYVFQKTYSWFQSGLPTNLDLRDFDDRKLVKEWNNRRLAFIKSQETFKKSNNPELRNYSLVWDPKEEEKKIRLSYEKTLIMFENYLKNQENRKRKVYENYYKELEENLNFWMAYDKRLSKLLFNKNNTKREN